MSDSPQPSRPIVILGPTAGGKSDLAVQLARQLPGGGEVLGADSMQVYRHLDAGTAKPPRKLREQVPHHLIDIVQPTQRFTVHDWLHAAQHTITQVTTSGGTPIIVGGTNLYLKALLEGLFDGPGQDEAFRATLRDLPGAVLHQRLQAIDPPAALRITPNDRQRLTRALEVFHLTGRRISALQTQWTSGDGGCGMADGGWTTHPDPSAIRHPPSAILLGLRWPVELINPRINLRVKAMFHPLKVPPEVAEAVCINGESLPDEVRRLVAEGHLLPGAQACEALGYKQVLGVMFPAKFPDLVDPLIKTLDDACERTKILTRRFAKQQRTWLKRFPDVHWIDMPCADQLQIALQALDNAKD